MAKRSKLIAMIAIIAIMVFAFGSSALAANNYFIVAEDQDGNAINNNKVFDDVASYVEALVQYYGDVNVVKLYAGSYSNDTIGADAKDWKGYYAEIGQAIANAQGNDVVDAIKAAIPSAITNNVPDDAKTAALNDVIAGSVVQADLTAYNEALAAVVEANYTPDSWAAYQQVVAANVVTADNTQAEVDAATAAIVAAQADLEAVAVFVDSVTADNYPVLAVTFSKDLTEVPADLTVLKGAEDITAEATMAISQEDAKVVNITVPLVDATTEDQTITYGVKLGDADAKTVDVTIEAAEPVATTIEVADVSVMENRTATPVVTVKDQYGNEMDDVALTYASSNQAVASVAIDGTITAGLYSAAANTATITVTAGEATGTATITVTQDLEKPALASVEALSGSQIKVVFNEKVDTATAENVTNYKLYSVAANGLYSFVAANASATAGSVVGVAQLQADQKTVIITITNTSTSTTGYVAANEQAGFVLNGLTNADYILYVSSVTDKAATPNTIISNTNKQFTGTTTPDATAPTLLSAAYDTGLKQLTLSFDEAPASVNVSKVKIVNGETEVVLNGASAANTALTSTITLTSDQAASVGTLQNGATVTLLAGAVKDAAQNANTAELTATINQAVRPEVTASSYDETNNKITVTFSQPIKTSNMDVTKIKVQWSTDGTNYTDLAAVDTTNYTVGQAGSSATAIEFALNQSAIDALGAKRATDNVQYRVGLQDSAVQSAAGTLWNDTGTAGGNDWQYAAFTYNKETVAPALTSANFYTTDATTPRYTGDTVGVQANHLYIKFDQKIRPSSLTNDGNLKLEYGTTTPKTSVSLTATAGHITAATLLADGYTLDVAFAAGAEVNAIAAGTAEVKVAATSSITDVNKNIATTGNLAVTYNNNAAAGTVTAVMHSATQIKLTQGVTNFSGTVSASNFRVYTSTNINDAKIIKSVNLIDTDNNNVRDAIFIELNAAPASPVTVAYTGLTDSIGQTIADGTANAGALVADTAAPLLVANASTYNDVDASTSVSAGDKVTLVFNEPVKAKATPVIAASYGTGATLSAGVNVNEIVITLGSSPAITFGTTNIEALSGDMIADITGIGFDGSATLIPTATGAAAPVFATGGTITATDVDANGKLSVGDKITIPFDKAINTALDITEANFKVENNGTDINVGTTFTAAAVGSDIVLTFTAVNAADAIDVSSAWSVAITGAGSNIKSSWGVEIGDITEKALTSNTTTAPNVVSASYNENTHQLKVVFSEAVNTKAMTSANDIMYASGTNDDGLFSVTTGYTLGALTNPAVGTGFWLDTTDTTNKTVVFVLDGSEIIDAGMVYINAAPGNGKVDAILDFDGNKIKRADTTGVLIAVSGSVSDTTAPTVSGVSITGADVTVTDADSTDTNITLAIPAGFAGNFTSGAATLSENVSVTVDAIQSQYDLPIPIGVTTSTNISNLILTWFEDGGDEGVSVATLLANNGSTVTLTDEAGNQTVYTLVVTQL